MFAGATVLLMAFSSMVQFGAVLRRLGDLGGLGDLLGVHVGQLHEVDQRVVGAEHLLTGRLVGADLQDLRIARIR